MVDKKQIFIKDLVDGQNLKQAFLVKSCQQAKTKFGKPFLSLVLGDRTASLVAKVWDNVEKYQPFLAAGSLVELSGQLSLYQGSLQLTVYNAKPLDWADVERADFVQVSRRSQKSMTDDLMAIVEDIQDPDYRRLVKAALDHPKTKDYWTIPAAKSFHHAYRGGLLEHSLSVAQLAVLVGRHYEPFLNTDLLVTGAILHDVGKCWEFTAELVADYTTAGRFLGHLVMGAMFLGEVAAELEDFPSEKLLLAQHLMVSHHGQPDFGSPQTPKILEALALHQLDDLDGKLNGVGAFIRQEINSKTSPGERWTSYFKLMESFYYAPEGSPLWGEELEEPEPAKPTPKPAPSPRETTPWDDLPIDWPMWTDVVSSGDIPSANSSSPNPPEPTDDFKPKYIEPTDESMPEYVAPTDSKLKYVEPTDESMPEYVAPTDSKPKCVEPTDESKPKTVASTDSKPNNAELTDDFKLVAHDNNRRLF
ncbi:MAG: HD domain-containing protein [Deltaproteobacteria bacterium]|jgi:3'-5' exoribonuclease|nr:HD domain-containing protein [Deltaproteobacteria bacterium]